MYLLRSHSVRCVAFIYDALIIIRFWTVSQCQRSVAVLLTGGVHVFSHVVTPLVRVRTPALIGADIGPGLKGAVGRRAMGLAPHPRTGFQPRQ